MHSVSQTLFHCVEQHPFLSFSHICVVPTYCCHSCAAAGAACQQGDSVHVYRVSAKHLLMTHPWRPSLLMPLASKYPQSRCALSGHCIYPCRLHPQKPISHYTQLLLARYSVALAARDWSGWSTCGKGWPVTPRLWPSQRQVLPCGSTWWIYLRQGWVQGGTLA